VKPGNLPKAMFCRQSVRFLFVRLDEERSLQKKKCGYTDELLARILYAAACIKKREDQLRRTTRDLRTRVAKCTEVDGGVFEHVL
jgi:DNA-directed RNA polymerase subunit M/transcription elongation factor TFIIS